jgi:hypothetical protein
MPKPRPSVLKRQREQAKREKNAVKAERRAQRKLEAAREDNPSPADAGSSED